MGALTFNFIVQGYGVPFEINVHPFQAGQLFTPGAGQQKGLKVGGNNRV